MKMAITEYIWNVDRDVLSRFFENTVWRINKCLETSGDTFSFTCNFRYCNNQVYRDFLITLYQIECVN
jgi:hypothetical protein